MESGWSSILVVTAAQRKDGGEYYCAAVIADTNETVSSNSHTLEIRGIDL